MTQENVSVGMGRQMTAEEKVQLAQTVKQFFAEELERDVGEIRDDAHLIDDLQLDSLLFLALFEELQAQYDVSIDTRKLAKVARQNPVETVGGLLTFITGIIEGTVPLD
jgi:acyl carrier protein